MLCLLNAVDDSIESFPTWQDLAGSLMVEHQINRVGSTECKTISLTEYIDSLKYYGKSLAGINSFFELLFTHPKVMLIKPHTQQKTLTEPHRIDRKSVIDTVYQNECIERITRYNNLFLSTLYIEENFRSNRTKSGKRQDLKLSFKGFLIPDDSSLAIEVFSRAAHLNFIDNLIYDIDAS